MLSTFEAENRHLEKKGVLIKKNVYENNNTMKRLITFKITVVTVVVSVVVAVVVIVPHATFRSPFHRSVFLDPFP